MSVAAHELVVVGAGPAGLAAAATAARLGVDTVVFDEQRRAGGQVFRNVEAAAGTARLLGEDYAAGAAFVERMRSSGASWRPGAMVWAIENGITVRVAGDDGPATVEARRVLIAAGAIERPFPVPGWTLPGVIGAGGAQVLMKSAGVVPPDGVVVAGTGPLATLIAWQLSAAGVRLGALLDTTPPANRWRAAARLPAALLSGPEIRKGLAMRRALRARGVRTVRGVAELSLLGNERVEALEFSAGGRNQRIAASMVLLHQGVVPDINLANASGCALGYDRSGLCFKPVTDAWGVSSVPAISIAGDGAGIEGARAAALRGEIAALGIACALGRIEPDRRDRAALAARRELTRIAHIRAFLDRLFRPPARHRIPVDDAVTVCRCEGVSAGTIRASVAAGESHPDAIKSRTRCGMGPCQARCCGLTLSAMIAAARGVDPGAVGYLRLRPPLKPIGLDVVLALESGAPPPEVALPDPLRGGVR